MVYGLWTIINHESIFFLHGCHLSHVSNGPNNKSHRLGEVGYNNYPNYSSVCYYLELRSAMTSYSQIQLLLMKIQYIVWTLNNINDFGW